MRYGAGSSLPANNKPRRTPIVPPAVAIAITIEHWVCFIIKESLKQLTFKQDVFYIL